MCVCVFVWCILVSMSVKLGPDVHIAGLQNVGV